MFQISRVALTLYFQMYVLNNQVHAHNTRQAEQIHAMSHNTNDRVFSIKVYGIKLWNDLSLDLTNCQTLFFKENVKHS